MVLFLSSYLNFCHYAQTIPSSAFVKQHNTLTKKMHEFEIMIFIFLSHYLAENKLWKAQRGLMGRCCVDVSEVEVC